MQVLAYDFSCCWCSEVLGAGSQGGREVPDVGVGEDQYSQVRTGPGMAKHSWPGMA